ncbi:MAG TPA: YsnF/AvaK domain-containing protein, partial [Caldilineaceae bacterium]|nr:YsnF/AvaK domain-containing protein [Caldilineaceae bacterium]
DMAIPEEHAGYYAEGIRRGGTRVSVQAPDADADNTVRILDRFNPVDINQRVTSWRASGWTGPSADDTGAGWSSWETSGAGYNATQSAEAMRGGRPSTKLNDGDEVAVDVVEEELHVGKRQVPGDTVRVHKQVVEKPVEEQVRLREEQVRVERRPADRPASEADLRPFENEVIEVDTMREEAVIEKQPRVVEEVVIKKDASERTETVRDTVRRTEVEVEGADDNFRTYDTTFRNHYQSNYANSGYSYEQYEPAYRYGYTLASDPRYRGRDWKAIESDARTYWGQHYPDSPWENFKGAIRRGWQRVRQAVNA